MASSITLNLPENDILAQSSLLMFRNGIHWLRQKIKNQMKEKLSIIVYTDICLGIVNRKSIAWTHRHWPDKLIFRFAPNNLHFQGWDFIKENKKKRKKVFFSWSLSWSRACFLSFFLDRYFFFLIAFLVGSVFSLLFLSFSWSKACFLVFFYKFPTLIMCSIVWYPDCSW